jgi:hypothetical protein
MICAPQADNSSGVTDLTDPRVPTGMKMGVSIFPRGISMMLVLALLSLALDVIWNVNISWF